MASLMRRTGDVNRRDFMARSVPATALSATAVCSVFPKGTSASPGHDDTGKVTMDCQDIANHFKATGDWVAWDKTTDTFKAGNAAKPVKKVAVAWKASWNALRTAVARGAEMFISHESICVNAVNSSPRPEVVFALPSEKPKFEWLERTGLVVYRCHDFWDRFPKEGVRDSWRAVLKIGSKIVADEYPFYVTEVDSVTVRELAHHVLQQIRPLGQNGIMVSGNLEKRVSRVGTGTGAYSKSLEMRELGADVGIITDDYHLHVRMGVHAAELDFPLIIVNHGVSEEWGIRNLARYLGRTFPALEVFHIPQYCAYKIIS